MVFLRRKTTRGRTYYQLVESHRTDGKPRQRVVLHLGRYPTVDEALKGWPKDIKRLRKRARDARKANPAPPLPGMEKKSSESPERLERRADDLEGKLRRLKKLRESGEV